MSDRFAEALRDLGHIYKARPEECSLETRVRHIAKLYVPTGEVKAICGSGGDDQYLCCPDLRLDSNCGQCREIEGLPPVALTKRSLMISLVNIMCDTEQMFLDAMYWNFYNPDKQPINPDPDGVLAKAWAESQIQLAAMVTRFQPTMQKHEERFGWPTEFGG